MSRFAVRRGSPSWSGLEAPRRSQALRRSILIYAGAVLLTVWGYVGVFIHHDRRVTVETASKHLAVIATATENHVHAMIYDGVGSAEAGAMELLARGDLQAGDVERIGDTLRRMLTGGEYVRAVFIATPTMFVQVAREGQVTASGPAWAAQMLAEAQRTNWIGPRMAHSEREYRAVFPIARRLPQADGAVVWVGALFGVQALDRLYEQIPLPGGAVSLINSDGALLLRAPRVRPGIDEARTATVNPRFQQAWSELLSASEGRLSLQAPSPFDQQEWLISMVRIAGYDMVAAAGQALDPVLAGWRLHARQSIQVAGVCTVVVVLLTFILLYELQGRMKALRRTREEFARQLLSTQEQERKRIANELHDSLGQNLSVIVNRAQLALLEPTVPGNAVRHLEIIQSVANDAIAEVRSLTRNLQPLYIDQLGLTGSLRTLVEQVASSGGVRIDAQIDDVDDVFDGASATHVYRIVQEALTNVMRHARAERARVHIERDVHSVRVCIEDEGVGFDVGTLNARAGIGVASMDARTRLLRGTLRIDSTPGAGVRLTATLPIEEAGATQKEPAASLAP